eukprot:CAMPEP_0117522178 /NCGR_PEP_ID=MMETSP0784-20121206/34073_1 /TAXON_ID=39447 /ORGANISM="" /LENGTH=340 /DNA_ID=CAMNT_0005318241 /DNA_START=47 /DNA_END=1065 /DNA_ORIENTATION=-
MLRAAVQRLPHGAQQSFRLVALQSDGARAAAGAGFLALRKRATIGTTGPSPLPVQTTTVGRTPAGTSAASAVAAARHSSSATPGPAPESSQSGSGPFAGKESQAKAEPDSGTMSPPGRDNIQFTWRSTVFTCVVGFGCLWYYDYLRRKYSDEQRASTRHERIGTPKLGGPFELVDRKGVVRTDADYKGQYLLIYFGFTFCPDICPQEMEKQTHAIELLDKEFGPVATPVFISIDPNRDTVAQVDDYCKEFHPRIVGLTGTPEQVKKVSRAYRVYYNEGIKTDDQDYLVDHSIIHYFVDRRGKFLDFFGKNMTAKEMAAKMRQTIIEDREKAAARKGRQGV